MILMLVVVVFPAISKLFRLLRLLLSFFFTQKTAYEIRISDWSSDVCSSDLQSQGAAPPIFSTMKTCCDCCGGCLPDRCSRERVICASPWLAHNPSCPCCWSMAI